MARKTSGGVSEKETRRLLSAESPEALADWVLGWSKTNRELRQQLKLWTLEKLAPGNRQLDEYRKALAKILRGRYGPYDAPTAAHDLDRFIESLDRLFRLGKLAAVIPLAEEARVGLDRLLLDVDDSNGEVQERGVRLEEIHCNACTEAQPNPVDLAERLFRMEMEGEFDVFDEAAFRYREILGESGLARYRTLAEAEWAILYGLRRTRIRWGVSSSGSRA
jgi:hypothetical protein